MSKLLLRVGGTALLFGFLAWRAHWDKVFHAFRDLRVELWFGAVGLYMLTQVISAFRWQMLARPLGLCCSVSRLTAYYFIGMFWNLVLPTSVGGDVVRAWYLDNHSGHRLLAFLSVFADRASGLIVLLGMACVAALVYPGQLPGWIYGFVGGAAAFTVVFAFVVDLLSKRMHRLARPVEDGDRKKVKRGRLVEMALHFLARLGRLLEHARLYLRRPRLLLEVTLLSLLVQAGNVVLVWMIGMAIGAKVPAGYYWIAVPMITLLTLLPISLNGMGIREWGMAFFLEPLGVDKDTAFTLAFLWFLVYTATGLSGGLVYLFGDFKRPEVEADEPVGDHSHQGRAGQPQAVARAPSAGAGAPGA